MSKKVFIGVGHGGNDPGAVKYITEKAVSYTHLKAWTIRNNLRKIYIQGNS